MRIVTLEEVGLSVRAYNCLKRFGINNLNDLEKYTKEDLMMVRNLGAKALDEVMEKCKENGICIKGQKWKITNYDRVRNMSLEELAKFIEDIQTDSLFLEGTIKDLKYPVEWKTWLESEFKNE